MDKKKNSTPKQITSWEKKYRSYYKKYRIIVCLSIATIAAIWWFTNCFWGLTALIFGIWNWQIYEDASTINCIDEYKYVYPRNALRRMFKSWPYFIFLVAITYYFCKDFIP